MNTFVTIMCCALVASAAAKPGYNYQQPSQFFRPSQPAGNSGIYSVQQSPPLASFNLQSQQQQQFQQNFVSTGPGPQLNAQPVRVVLPPSIGLPAPPQYAASVQQQFTAPSTQYIAPVQQQYSAPAPVSQYQPTYHQPQQQQTIISKDIFIHAAPEETEEIGADRGVEVGPNRKNYRIVFIKAPTQNLRLNLNALKRAQSSNEEKTVIYVLSKKPDYGNLQSQLASVQTQNKAHKPEVFFIKYKTQDEANRAQQEIQAQYDSLGGSTSITDSGITPVTSVIGGGPVNIGSVGPSFSGSAGPSFSGSDGPLFSGSAGSSFSGSAVPSFSGSAGTSFNDGNNFAGPVQQQQFSQQSYQSNQGSTSSSVSFGGEPSQKYLPASKK